MQKETKWYEKPKFIMMLDALDCRKDLLKHIHDLDSQGTDLSDNILQYKTMNDVRTNFFLIKHQTLTRGGMELTDEVGEHNNYVKMSEMVDDLRSKSEEMDRRIDSMQKEGENKNEKSIRWKMFLSGVLSQLFDDNTKTLSIVEEIHVPPFPLTPRLKTWKKSEHYRSTRWRQAKTRTKPSV